MSMFVSPGVYNRLLDLSQAPRFDSPSIACTTGGSRRGPLGAKYITSLTRRAELYGPNDPSWGFMLDSCDAFLQEGNQLYVNRVVEADSKYALGLIANNSIAGKAAGTAFSSIPGGSFQQFDAINRDVWDYEISADLQAGQTISGTINGTAYGPINYSTSHIATMTAWVQAIQSTLDTLGAGGFATLISTGNDLHIIRIVSPQAITLIHTGSVTGTSPPTFNRYQTDWLTFVVTENPGKWGNKIAAGIQSVDQGTAQRVTVTISTALVTGNTLAMNINGQTISAVYATSSNHTLDLFAAAYELAFPGGLCLPQSTGGSVNSTRQFILVAPDAKADLTITSANVTGGATQATVSYSETLKRIAPTGQFNFVVYENTDFRSPDEFYKASYEEQVDGLGNQLNLEYSVNKGPLKSDRVRVYVNPFFSGLVNDGTSPTNSNYQRYLTGGSDGSLPTNGSVVNGWNAFSSPEKITVRILINGGYATPEVHQKMTNLCDKRMDCFAILDTPSDQQSSQNAVNYRRFVMNIDSKYGALYSPDVLIFDPNTNMRRYIPPSGLVAAQYAYTDRVAREWFAPAGLTRGLIRNAMSLRVDYDEGDRDLLSAYQVNAIRRYGSAFPIWGEYTLQQMQSSLSSVPVVRLLITIMTTAANIVAYSVFEPNDPMTWHQIRARLTDLLQPIANARGLYSDDGVPFRVYCDERNNQPATRDQRRLNASMWLKPTLSALYIQLTSVITRSGANFDIEFAQTNGTV